MKAEYEKLLKSRKRNTILVAIFKKFKKNFTKIKSSILALQNKYSYSSAFTCALHIYVYLYYRVFLYKKNQGKIDLYFDIIIIMHFRTILWE